MSAANSNEHRISAKTLHHRFMIALAEIKGGLDVNEGEAIDAMLSVAIIMSTRHHGHDEVIETLRGAADALVCAETAVEIRRSMN